MGRLLMYTDFFFLFSSLFKISWRILLDLFKKQNIYVIFIPSAPF